MKQTTRDSRSLSGTIRVQKDSDYKAICNKGPRDSRLSWGARGILTYLLTKPDDWNPTVEDLINQGPEGKAAVRRMLNELKQFGYLKRERINQGNGKFIWQTTLYEVSQGEDYSHEIINKPSTENQHMEPSTDLPSMVKPSNGFSVDIRSKEKRSIEKLNIEGVGGINTAREKIALPEPPTRPPKVNSQNSFSQNIVTLITIPEPIRKALANLCEYPPDENNPRDQAELKQLFPFLGERFPDMEMAAQGIADTFKFWDKSSPPKLSQILREWPRMEKRAKGELNATTGKSNPHPTARQYAAQSREQALREELGADYPY